MALQLPYNERYWYQVVVRFSLEKLTWRLGSRVHRRGHDLDRLLYAGAAMRQPATVMSAVNAATGNGEARAVLT